MLFVMFGVDNNLHQRTDFQVLNTDTWTWIDSYVGPGRNSTNDTSNEPPEKNDGSSGGGLSGGAIAGVVVGAIAGVTISLLHIERTYVLTNFVRLPLLAPLFSFSCEENDSSHRSKWEKKQAIIHRLLMTTIPCHKYPHRHNMYITLAQMLMRLQQAVQVQLHRSQLQCIKTNPMYILQGCVSNP